MQDFAIEISNNKNSTNFTPHNNWRNLSLRKCLFHLGFSDEEMRYRKGCRSIMENWVNEEKTLLEMVKKKWKSLVIIHHEATGNNPEIWKNINFLYSTALKKITLAIRKLNDIPYIEYECFICKNPVTKRIISPFQLKSKICSTPDCWRQYHNYRTKRYRNLLKPVFERFCDGCGKRFSTSNKKKRRCSPKCSRRVALFNCREKNKIKYNLKSNERRKKTYSQMTIEQKREFNKKRYLRFRRQIENETPEQRKVRLDKNSAGAREWRGKLSAEKKLEIHKKYYITPLQQLEKFRIKYKDKPWILETWLQTQKEKGNIGKNVF